MGAGGLLKLLPELFGEFSKNKYQIPVTEMTRVLKPTHQIEKKIINWDNETNSWRRSVYDFLGGDQDPQLASAFQGLSEFTPMAIMYSAEDGMDADMNAESQDQIKDYLKNRAASIGHRGLALLDMLGIGAGAKVIKNSVKKGLLD